jgi:WD40 repeat protein/serine/threonine protein kinase
MLRTRNAKSAKERHDLAYFGWEASVRLAVAAAPPADRAKLAMPSTGDWVSALPADDRIFDDAALLAVHRLLSEEGQGRGASPQSTTPTRLLASLPAYRNAILGHGAVRDLAFYERAGEVLAAGLDAAWARALLWPDGARLVCVEAIEVESADRHRARVLDLCGTSARLIDPRGTDVPKSVLPRQIYLEQAGTYRSLHPWLLYEAAELRERVLFFNGRGRNARFLDYVGGEQVKGKPLATAWPTLEAELDAAMLGHTTEEAEPKDPNQFGDYRILGKLGEGGMGVVYLARQESLERVVALKKLPPGAANDAVAVARFRREIAALARCEHPNIVKILAAGEIDGQHYYAMEVVEGADLAEVAHGLGSGVELDQAISSASMRMRRARSEPGDATPDAPRSDVAVPARAKDRTRMLAEMFRDSALAIAHLHDNGIIHRDLKPANLMVTNEQRVVVMDLGLAAIGDASQSLTKDKSSILGTLRYLPPEQLQRNLLTLDRRADIYSLGATFYELFTSKPFFDGDSDARLVEQVLRQTPVDPRRANPALPRDLALILTKATDKDPKLRYDDATALARDLDAYLAGRPITARPPSIGYLLKLAIRRNRALAATILAAIVLAIGGATWFLVRERVLRGEAEAARDQARVSEQRTKRALAENQLEQGRLELLAQHPARAAALIAQAYPTLRDEPMVRFLAAHAARGIVRPAATLSGHKLLVRVAAFSPDGQRVVTASEDHTARIWDVATGKLVATLAHDDKIFWAAYSADGKRIVTASDDHTARLWDAATGAPLAKLEGHTDKLMHAAFSPDGQRVATASRDKTARVWDAATGAPIATLTGHTGVVHTVAFSPDGKTVGTSSYDHDARLWDAATGKLLQTLHGHTKELESLAFSPDGARVLTACDDTTARLWDARTGAALATLSGHTGEVFAATFSPDGTHIITASADRSARIWDAQTLKVVANLTGHTSDVMTASFSPDGKLAVTASRDHTARIWDAHTGALAATLEAHTSELWFAAFSADGEHVITTSRDATARIWNAHAGKRMLPLVGHTARVRTAAFSPDGARVVTASGDKTARVWDARTGKELLVLTGHTEGVRTAAFSPDGKRIVTAGDDQTVRVWDSSTGAALATYRPHAADVAMATYSPDGRYIATASADKTASLLDAQTGAVVTTLRGHTGPVRAVRVSNDGRRVVTASADNTARIWELPSGKLVATLQGHAHFVLSAAFSADGQRVITAGADLTARAWNATTREQQLLIDGHAGVVWDAAFSPDGQRIVTASADKSARVWDAATGKELARLEGHSDEVTAAQLSADGGWLATASADNTAAIWDVHLDDHTPEAYAAAVQPP